jgi:hypothetical protein
VPRPKPFAAALLAILLAAACASGPQDSGFDVRIHFLPLDTFKDMFFSAGPVTLRYQVTVANPLPQPVTLLRLDLRSVGIGAYSLRPDSHSLNVKIPPKSTAEFAITAYGTARGGQTLSGEPVTLQGAAHFQGPDGQFVKFYHQNIVPQ